ncbi:uncharacterized protein F4822DRAFT_434330 [Hypoxylon trugodes]|uniref:uncharacterized protein n=1 Tax=Hypoxylon trugodes TaxID=326681 RepID=UPI002197EA22|nr:uncharacterized protein F4822DRAFT_434330 [Hypoxylon trugodes]KAI1383211.1 hypothetical protein F4822DRAFT_434330 [Hypoxylon trugodes]
MVIKIHNMRLWAVIGTIMNVHEIQVGQMSVDGLMLFKYRLYLRDKLKYLRQLCFDDHQSILERSLLSLLVTNTLLDPQLLKSYGFLWLCNRGYMDMDEWEWFYGTHCIPKYGKSQAETSDELRSSVSAEPLRLDDGDDGDDVDIEVDSRKVFSSPKPIHHQICSSRFYEECKLLANTHPEYASLIRYKLVPSFRSNTWGVVNDSPASHVQFPTRFLLTTIRCNCIQVAGLLLKHGFDPNSVEVRETPLSVAAETNSKLLIRLLLSYGADVQIAILVIKNQDLAFEDDDLDGKSRKLRAIGKLIRLSDTYFSDLSRKATHTNFQLMRLRNKFWGEHSTIVCVAKDEFQKGKGSLWVEPYYRSGKERSYSSVPRDATNLTRYLGANTSSAWTTPTPNSLLQYCRTNMAISSDWARHLEMDTGSAWTLAVSTMRQLCTGAPPTTCNEVILFLCLAKSMAGIVDDGSQKLERAFFDDISRWQLTLRNPYEIDLFIAATKAIWNIDARMSTKGDILGHKLFTKTLQRFQDLTTLLASQAMHILQVSGLDDLSLEKVQRRCQERQRRMSTGSFEPLESVNTPDLAPKITAEPIEISPYSDISTCDDNPPDVNPHLAILLAGAIFAIMLAFLLVLRNPLYATAVGVFLALDAVGCDPTRLVERNYELLKLFIQISIDTASSDGATSVQEVPCILRFRHTVSSCFGNISQASEQPSFASGSSSDSGTLLASNGQVSPSTIARLTTSARLPASGEKKFICDVCGHGFDTRSNHGKHYRDMHEKKRYLCSVPGCGKSFQRNDIRGRHEEKRHFIIRTGVRKRVKQHTP